MKRPDTTGRRRDALPDLVGRQVARRYRIERSIGEGRVGAVYRAEDRTERRPVALKIYRPSVVPGAPDTEAMVADMAAATRLGHASIVPVFDVGTHAGKYLYTVEPLLAGRSLAQRLGEGGPLDADLVSRVGGELASALAVLHRSNLLHLDLTPENVFLVRDPLGMERVALTAPGCRHILGLANASHEEGAGCLARPAYLAPELVFGKAPEVTTDVYLLGSLLYELLVGQPPCRADDFASAARRHVVEKPTPIAEARPSAEAPTALRQLIMRCLEKSADKRWPSMNKLVWALDELLGRESSGAEVTFLQSTSTSPPPAILDWAPIEDPPADSTEFTPKNEDGLLDELAAAVEVAAFRQRVGWSTPPPQAKPEPVEPSEPPPLPEGMFEDDLRASDPPPADETLRAALQAAREESIPGLSLEELEGEEVVDTPGPLPTASAPPASMPPPPIEAVGVPAERPEPRPHEPPAAAPDGAADAPDEAAEVAPARREPEASVAPWVEVKRTPLPEAEPDPPASALLGPAEPDDAPEPPVDARAILIQPKPAPKRVEAPQHAAPKAAPEPPVAAPPAAEAAPTVEPPPAVEPTPAAEPAADAEPTAAVEPSPAAAAPPEQTDEAPDVEAWRPPRAGPSPAVWAVAALVVVALVGWLALRGGDDAPPPEQASAAEAPDPSPPTAAPEAPRPADPAAPGPRDPEAAAAAVARGEALLERAQWDAAADAFAEATQLDPESAAAHAGRAAAEFQRERFAAAAEHGARAVQLAPINTEYGLRLGMAHFKLERYDAANAAWQAVLATEPNNATARRYLALLDRRRAAN